jgi:outer membrane lipoprotein-sorting protein
MHQLKTLLLLFLAAATACTSLAAFAAEDVASVLAKIDAASAGVRTISADFEWKTVQSEPVKSEEIQVGSIFFKRAGTNAFEMAADIRTVDGKSVPKILTYSQGTATLYEKLKDQFHTFKAGDKASVYESLLLLGFGSNRKDLTRSWNLTFIRSEEFDGINCDVLELTPRDDEIRRSLKKVTIWFDVARGVGVKQVFDEGEGARRECIYSNIKINRSLPREAFRQR